MDVYQLLRKFGLVDDLNLTFNPFYRCDSHILPSMSGEQALNRTVQGASNHELDVTVNPTKRLDSHLLIFFRYDLALRVQSGGKEPHGSAILFLP